MGSDVLLQKSNTECSHFLESPHQPLYDSSIQVEKLPIKRLDS